MAVILVTVGVAENTGAPAFAVSTLFAAPCAVMPTAAVVLPYSTPLSVSVESPVPPFATERTVVQARVPLAAGSDKTAPAPVAAAAGSVYVTSDAWACALNAEKFAPDGSRNLSAVAGDPPSPNSRYVADNSAYGVVSKVLVSAKVKTVRGVVVERMIGSPDIGRGLGAFAVKA